MITVFFAFSLCKGEWTYIGEVHFFMCVVKYAVHNKKEKDHNGHLSGGGCCYCSVRQQCSGKDNTEGLIVIRCRDWTLVRPVWLASLCAWQAGRCFGWLVEGCTARGLGCDWNHKRAWSWCIIAVTFIFTVRLKWLDPGLSSYDRKEVCVS